MNRLTGQAENNGTSIIDVTDPAQPVYLIPGLGAYEEGGAQTGAPATLALPKGDPSKTHAAVFGGRGHEIWDVTDPAKQRCSTKSSWD
jgi:hypothetical protein